MSVYKFKEGSRLYGDAQAVGTELAAIQQRAGAITPKTVLAAARGAESSLHQYFEWDDEKAAEAHRLEQAGHLIRCVTIEIEPEQRPATPEQLTLSAAKPAEVAAASVQRMPSVRAFMAVNTPQGHRVYLSTTEALGDTEYRRQVLQQAHFDLGAVARKYRELKELSAVIEAIDRVGEILHEAKAETSAG